MLKRLLILSNLMLSLIVSSVAQTVSPQIDGFWEIQLGETEDNVVRKVQQLYPSAKYVEYTYGTPLKAINVKLEGLDVSNCEFKFKDGIFTKATFTQVAGWKNIKASQMQSYFNSLEPKVKSDYQAFYDIISQKYGIPEMSGQTATWRTSNGNSITVKPWSKSDEYVDRNGETWAGKGIYIIYSTKGESSNDYL